MKLISSTLDKIRLRRTPSVIWTAKNQNALFGTAYKRMIETHQDPTDTPLKQKLFFDVCSFLYEKHAASSSGKTAVELAATAVSYIHQTNDVMVIDNNNKLLTNAVARYIDSHTDTKHLSIEELRTIGAGTNEGLATLEALERNCQKLIDAGFSSGHIKAFAKIGESLLDDIGDHAPALPHYIQAVAQTADRAAAIFIKDKAATALKEFAELQKNGGGRSRPKRTVPPSTVPSQSKRTRTSPSSSSVRDITPLMAPLSVSDVLPLSPALSLSYEITPVQTPQPSRAPSPLSLNGHTTPAQLAEVSRYFADQHDLSLAAVKEVISSLPNRVTDTNLNEMQEIGELMVRVSATMLQNIAGKEVEKSRAAREENEKMGPERNGISSSWTSVIFPGRSGHNLADDASPIIPARSSSPLLSAEIDDVVMIHNSAASYSDPKQFEPLYKTISSDMAKRTTARINKKLFCDVCAFLDEHGQSAQALNLGQQLRNHITQQSSGMADAGGINLNKHLTDVIASHIVRQGPFSYEELKPFSNGTSIGMGKLEALNRHGSELMNHEVSWGFDRGQLINIAKLKEGENLLNSLAGFDKNKINIIKETHNLTAIIENIKTNQDVGVLEAIAIGRNNMETQVTARRASSRSIRQIGF